MQKIEDGKKESKFDHKSIEIIYIKQQKAKLF